MAEKDIAGNTFIALNDVFADIFNALLFEGKQTVVPEALVDVIPTSQYRADDTKLHEQERDTNKLWQGNNINLVLAGIESQAKPDKDMPFRIISYDGASYRSQLLKTEERMVGGKATQVQSKNRYPVITIVLYFGKEHWNYPLNLCNCFYPELPENETTEILKKYIQDYKIHVFDIPRLKQEEIKRFRSDFRIVADYFTHAYVDKYYVPENARISHVDEFLKLMKVLTGDARYEEIGQEFTKEEKESGLTMCEVLDAREARGEARGVLLGAERLGKLMEILLGKNMVEEAKKAASDAKVREEYYKLYNIV